jgi:hypothetical protein
MESDGSARSGLLTVGGILSITAGTFEIVGGGALVAIVVSPALLHALLYPLALAIYPPRWPDMPTWLIVVGVSLIVLGVIAIVGGVSALRKKRFSLSLAGAICAVPSVVLGLSLTVVVPGLSSVILDLRLAGTIFCALPSSLLGILAVVFVALGKREIGAETENGTQNNRRGKLLSAGGILSMVAGIFQMNNGAVLVAFSLTHVPGFQIMPFWGFTPFPPRYWTDYWDFLGFHYGTTTEWIIMGVAFLVLGILAIVGGVSALRRKSFGLSLAGAIAALASGLLGIVAIVFVALGRREFGAKE